jgi:hypothetical protein
MSWLDTLDHELRARGIPGAERGRILAELRDHIDCDPGSEGRLGDPRELAASFADELATSRVRRSALRAFGALTTAAAALAVSQLAIPAAGGYPGFANGISLALFFPALVGIFFAPQVALVAGTLAAWRALRRRRSACLPAAEIGLIGSRARVALGAGFATVAGLGLYLVDFSARLPGWYLGAVGGCAAAAVLVLGAAYRSLVQAGAIVATSAGPAGDLFEDLPVPGRRWLRRHPWGLGVAGSLAAGIAATIFAAEAERSLLEGVERGVIEDLGALVGFVILGRAVGLMPGADARRRRRLESGPSDLGG